MDSKKKEALNTEAFKAFVREGYDKNNATLRGIISTGKDTYAALFKDQNNVSIYIDFRAFYSPEINLEKCQSIW